MKGSNIRCACFTASPMQAGPRSEVGMICSKCRSYSGLAKCAFAAKRRFLTPSFQYFTGGRAGRGTTSTWSKSIVFECQQKQAARSRRSGRLLYECIPNYFSAYFLKLSRIACQPACWKSTGCVFSGSNVSITLVLSPSCSNETVTFRPSPKV